MPKRIVFAVWGSLGDLYPYLAIARQLQLWGHHCIVAPHYLARPRVESAGWSSRPWARTARVVKLGVAVLHSAERNACTGAAAAR
jgi:UDP:flavonoid glycosyltransferase YjiC (YdhE family)